MTTENTAATSATNDKAAKNWREFQRGKEIKMAESLKMPLDLIEVKPGFNPRDMNKPETRAKIEGIKKAYMEGEYVKPLEVALAGDHVVIVDGECRWTAANEAHKELLAQGGMGIPYLVCIPFKGNDADRLVLTIHGNEGEKLTQIECSDVVKRLLGMGWDRQKVADKLNYSIGWVDRLIVLSKMPEMVKKMVNDGKVSPEVAAKMFKKHGDETEAALNKLLEGKAEKVTSKHVADKDGEESSAEKTEKAKVVKESVKQLQVARDLAFDLPEFGVARGVIRATETYSISISGKVYKKLLELQDLFAGPADKPAKEKPTPKAKAKVAEGAQA